MRGATGRPFDRALFRRGVLFDTFSIPDGRRAYLSREEGIPLEDYSPVPLEKQGLQYLRGFSFRRTIRQEKTDKEGEEITRGRRARHTNHREGRYKQRAYRRDLGILHGHTLEKMGERIPEQGILRPHARKFQKPPRARHGE